MEDEREEIRETKRVVYDDMEGRYPTKGEKRRQLAIRKGDQEKERDERRQEERNG